MYAYMYECMFPFLLARTRVRKPTRERERERDGGRESNSRYDTTHARTYAHIQNKQTQTGTRITRRTPVSRERNRRGAPSVGNTKQQITACCWHILAILGDRSSQHPHPRTADSTNWLALSASRYVCQVTDNKINTVAECHVSSSRRLTRQSCYYYVSIIRNRCSHDLDRH